MSGNSIENEKLQQKETIFNRLQKRQRTCLRASEEDKQKLAEQLTNVQDMVKKLRTENLSLKIKMRNIEKIQQKTTKRNEELKITTKMLQQEQLIYSTSLRNQIHLSTCVDYLLNNSIFLGTVCGLIVM